MTSPEAAAAISRGLLDEIEDIAVDVLPVGDGGEGTVDALARSLKDVETVRCRTVDPLHRPIEATYGIAGRRTAFIESAAASGLTLLKKEERDVLNADSYGTGLLIADAYNRGVRDFVVCMGGTATCDGGIGAYKAMRAKGVGTGRFTLLCDVDNPLCGPSGASAVFGPQKGASPDMIPRLEERLATAADIYFKESHIDVRNARFAGAAGGLAGMLMACFGASPCYGIEKVLEILEFDSLLKKADLVITGEGRADATTLRGKTAQGILQAAKRRGVPVALLAGTVADRPALLDSGFDYVMAATPENRDPEISFAEYLSAAARNFAREILKGR